MSITEMKEEMKSDKRQKTGQKQFAVLVFGSLISQKLYVGGRTTSSGGVNTLASVGLAALERTVFGCELLCTAGFGTCGTYFFARTGIIVHSMIWNLRHTLLRTYRNYCAQHALELAVHTYSHKLFVNGKHGML